MSGVTTDESHTVATQAAHSLGERQSRGLEQLTSARALRNRARDWCLRGSALANQAMDQPGEPNPGLGGRFDGGLRRITVKQPLHPPGWRRDVCVSWVLALGLMLVGVAQADSDQGKSKAAKTQASSASQTPLPGVVVTAVQLQDVAAEHRYIGTVKAIQSVEVRARVEGFLEKVAFEQGRMVKADQLLYQIEQDQYQAALASAEGQLAASQAQLASAKATLADKQADFQRFATLVKQGDTSQTNFDRAKAQRDAAQAKVDNASAGIKQAQAAIEQAKINLGYTTISSPIAGRIGATRYTEGNVVNPSSGTSARSTTRFRVPISWSFRPRRSRVLAMPAALACSSKPLAVSRRKS